MQGRPLSIATAAGAASRSSTSLITKQVTILADQPPRLVDAHLVEFLTIEMIRIIVESEAVSRSLRAQHEQLVQADLARLSPSIGSLSLNNAPSRLAASGRAGNGEKSEKEKAEERERADEGVRRRLDDMGFKVGWALAERLSRDKTRFPMTAQPPSSTPQPVNVLPSPDALEVVKFVCKDIWVALYDKQIDNLRTNHRGVFVLSDNAFKPLLQLSGAGPSEDVQVARMAKFLLAFPCGVVRGTLATLGITCTVSAESPTPPQSTFQIKTSRPTSVA